jgi:serine-type D-Ala-D-Ala carboxypeptidase (penicillin-binding protein 5/6)
LSRRIWLLCVPLTIAAALAGTIQLRGEATASLSTAAPRAAAPAADGATTLNVNGTRFRPEGPVTDPPRVRARSWVVADLDRGLLLGVHRSNGHLPMASTIKLLSAVTAARTVARYPDHKVTRREAHPAYCSCAGLKVGRRYTRHALLAGLLLPSGNDAAEALAGSHPNGRRAFVGAMNRIATELGATDTHAANPSGLTAPGAYSTARDLLTLLRAAQREPVVERVLDLSTFEFGPRSGRRHTVRRSTDYVNLYADRWPGTQGKSGFTTPAKNTLVVNTPVRGHHIGVAILGAPYGKITPAARRLTLWAARNIESLLPVGRLPR